MSFTLLPGGGRRWCWIIRATVISRVSTWGEAQWLF
jgi:hypothetical protein